MEVLSKENVSAAIKQKEKRWFTDVFEALESGTAIRLSIGEWHYRTPISYYFLNRYNRNGKKIVSVRKLNRIEYLVIKL